MTFCTDSYTSLFADNPLYTFALYRIRIELIQLKIQELTV